MVGGTHRVGGARLRAAVLATVLLPGVLATGSGTAQAGPTRQPRFAGAPEWQDAGPASARAARSARDPDVRVRSGRRVLLERGVLAARLDRAPDEAASGRPRRPVLTIPTPAGGTARFAIVESPVVAPALGRRHPETRTYVGTGVDDPASTISLDLGPVGFHAQVLSPGGNWYIDPETRGDDRTHVAYRRRDLVDDHGPWREAAILGDRAARAAPAPSSPARPAAARTIGPVLRTYRLALATTGEYSTFHGGTVPLVHNALVTAVNRVNGIFRRELGVQLQLVANNDTLIRLDPATDGYTNSDADLLMTQNQGEVDGFIGDANYDIGHVFSTAAGGVAGLGVVGLSGQKALGTTGRAEPTGDAFWVDYVAHELGHQFGAQHTFSGIDGNCSGNGVAADAVEPGSGTSIMGYAGACGTDDLQSRTKPQSSSDPYFHARSFDQIQALVTSPGRGGTTSATGNSAPTVTPNGGAAWTVPPRTPFVLSATATDANATDAVTLQWDQYDGGALRPLTADPKSNGALFRSLPPTVGRTGSRTFPRLTSILTNRTNADSGTCPALPGGLACWSEFLPTSARTMKFRVTARDNRVTGGGVTTADATVAVAGTTPFRVTSQNTRASLSGSRAITVTWNTAGTTAAPFNIPTVDIRITTDGGNTYTMLAAATPNDGSQPVVLPGLATTTGRIQVRAVGGIFFDLNDADLTIRASTVAVGFESACALTTGGGAKCWGGNSFGALGTGVSPPTLDSSSVPVAVTGLTGATALAAGSFHSCARVTAGALKCWGRNFAGALGNGTTTDSNTPVSVLSSLSPPTPLTGVAAFSAGALAGGAGHTCALLTTGAVRCWGYNPTGNLGNGTTTDSTLPVPVLGTLSPPTPLTGAVAIAAGGYHTCALMNTATVRCWGDNSAGQLGNGTTTGPQTCPFGTPCATTPIAVPGLTGVVAIAAGGSHTCALTTGGTVKCWGANGDGQLGTGSTADSASPVTVTGLTGVVAVAAGNYNTCALLAVGTAKCWGFNGSGQLGNGLGCTPSAVPDNCRSYVPVGVVGLTGAVALSVGQASSCARLVGGAARCWGLDSSGQLGNGAGPVGNYSPVPVAVTGLP